MVDFQQQKMIFQKQITDFMEGIGTRFLLINNYQAQKGKLGYQTKLNIPNKSSNIFLNLYY